MPKLPVLPVSKCVNITILHQNHWKPENNIIFLIYTHYQATIPVLAWQAQLMIPAKTLRDLYEIPQLLTAMQG